MKCFLRVHEKRRTAVAICHIFELLHFFAMVLVIPS